MLLREGGVDEEGVLIRLLYAKVMNKGEKEDDVDGWDRLRGMCGEEEEEEEDDV